MARGDAIQVFDWPKMGTPRRIPLRAEPKPGLPIPIIRTLTLSADGKTAMVGWEVHKYRKPPSDHVYDYGVELVDVASGKLKSSIRFPEQTWSGYRSRTPVELVGRRWRQAVEVQQAGEDLDPRSG